ncbi:glycosyltransferase family 4 protein [Sphingobacterium sp. HJSM2_6]|uniref:glycosyltransferase family 4 protein n=1 Tax=Sphingobacterium sp. HJSM2_6 TaxID=3366264 RepID=UPI003BC2D66F
MRILIIHNEYQHLGGEDFVMTQEMQALEKEHTVAVYRPKNKKGLAGYMQYLCYPINGQESKKIIQKIKDFQPDIIHIHNLHYALGPLFILHVKKIGVPMCMTVHNFRLLCPSATLFYDGNIFLDSISARFPWRAIKLKVLENSYLKTFWTSFTYWIHKKRGTFQQIDRFIVLSEFSKRLFERSNFGIEAEKLLVKPNFVKEITPNEPLPSEAFVYVGRLSEEKGILPLLHAWKATQHHLKIFGTGPLQKEVELIAEHSPNITYYGFQNKQVINNHLVGSTAAIVPSLCYESMPLAVIEAFALGVPVLASNIGILAEMVVPLKTGMLFDPHQHSSLIQTLNAWKALAPLEKEQIKKNCRADFLAKYQEGKVMNELLAIYAEIIHSSQDKKI